METYLSHHGILGMKWGVRRYQNKDGTLTAAGKRRAAKEEKNDREARSRESNSYAHRGNKFQNKHGQTLTRQTSKHDDPEARKRRIDQDIKEADDRVKFYGSKRAAKAAIKDEAGYRKACNRGKAAFDSFKYGSLSGISGAALLTLLSNGAGGAAVVGFGVPAAVAAAIVASGAAKTNRYIDKHAKEQIAYTDESEYAHDIVVALKKHD